VFIPYFCLEYLEQTEMKNKAMSLQEKREQFEMADRFGKLEIALKEFNLQKYPIRKSDSYYDNMSVRFHWDGSGSLSSGSCLSTLLEFQDYNELMEYLMKRVGHILLTPPEELVVEEDIPA